MKLLSVKRPRNYWRNFILVYLGVALLTLLVAVPLGVTYLFTHPRRYPLTASPADLQLPYESVTFAAPDGVQLAGWYIRSQNHAAVILLHGGGGDRSGTLNHAQALSQLGYGVLLFDMRGFGESEGCLCRTLEGPAEDVRGAVTFLKQRSDVDPDRIGIMGLSLGAMVALRAAADQPDLRAVVADGANEFRDLPPEFEPFPEPIRAYARYNSWVFNQLTGQAGRPLLGESVRQIAPRSLLLIAAGSGYELEDNRVFFNLAGEPRELWEVPDAPHCGGLLTHPETYQMKLKAFFQRALLDHP